MPKKIISNLRGYTLNALISIAYLYSKSKDYIMDKVIRKLRS